MKRSIAGAALFVLLMLAGVELGLWWVISLHGSEYVVLILAFPYSAFMTFLVMRSWEKQ